MCASECFNNILLNLLSSSMLIHSYEITGTNCVSDCCLTPKMGNWLEQVTFDQMVMMMSAL
jgi:hypothetical protein